MTLYCTVGKVWQNILYWQSNKPERKKNHSLIDHPSRTQKCKAEFCNILQTLLSLTVLYLWSLSQPHMGDSRVHATPSALHSGKGGGGDLNIWYLARVPWLKGVLAPLPETRTEQPSMFRLTFWNVLLSTHRMPEAHKQALGRVLLVPNLFYFSKI